jgi:hypothetical protein
MKILRAWRRPTMRGQFLRNTCSGFLVATALLIGVTTAVDAQGEIRRAARGHIVADAGAAAGVRESSTIPQPGAPATLDQDSTLYLPSILNILPCGDEPRLYSPLNNSTLNTLRPTFQYTFGLNPAATERWFEVALDPAFTQRKYWTYSTNIHGTTDTMYYARPHVNLNPATLYYFRAYVKCGSSLALYSDVWSLTTGSGGTILPAPTLLEPSSGSQVPSTTVTLRWLPVSGADLGYMVYYGKVGGSQFLGQVNDTSLVVGPLDAATTYEWWVKAANDYALGSSSAKWQFTTP